MRFHWTSPRDASNPAFLLAAAGAAVAAAMDGAGLLAGTTDRFDEVAHAKLIINCGMNAVSSPGSAREHCKATLLTPPAVGR